MREANLDGMWPKYFGSRVVAYLPWRRGIDRSTLRSYDNDTSEKLPKLSEQQSDVIP
jgi:hypothetical protein